MGRKFSHHAYHTARSALSSADNTSPLPVISETIADKGLAMNWAFPLHFSRLHYAVEDLHSLHKRLIKLSALNPKCTYTSDSNILASISGSSPLAKQARWLLAHIQSSAVTLVDALSAQIVSAHAHRADRQTKTAKLAWSCVRSWDSVKQKPVDTHSNATLHGIYAIDSGGILNANLHCYKNTHTLLVIYVPKFNVSFI